MTLSHPMDSDRSDDRPGTGLDGALSASALFESTPLPMWVRSERTGAILAANPALIRRYGYSLDQLRAMRAADLLADDESRACADPDTSGHDVAPEQPALTRHRWKDGSVRDVRVIAHPIVFDDEPAVLELLEDVTERTTSEHGRTLLLTAIEQLDELVLVFEPHPDPEQPPQISYANHAVARTLGIPPRGAPNGQYTPDRTPPELAELRALISKGLDCDRSTRQEIVWRAPSGRRFRLETAAVPVPAPDGVGVSHWAVVARDVTEQRSLAERSAQAQRLESLGLLAGSIAHDFNNLVHVVTGFSELALGQLPAKGPPTAYVQQAHEAALRAAGLAKQLLAFSRRQQLKPVRLDLRALLTALRPVLARLAGPRVPVTMSLGDTPAMVSADPTQMEQIFLNLVVNARDAQPDGGKVEITLDVVPRADVPLDQLPQDAASERWVRVRVSDAGPGMPLDVQARVFEPFFTTKSQGTGLGLSTVHGIVRQSGGAVVLHSEPGRGLTAIIVLPRAEGATENA